MNSRLVVIVAWLGLVPLVADAQAPQASQLSASSAGEDSGDGRLASAGLSSPREEAQSGISEAMGRDIQGYQAHVRGAGFQTENARHKLLVDFTSEGVALHTGSAVWRLALSGFGYGNTLRALSRVSPRVKFNRVEYQRGSLTEWYVNGPLGLEQGFTVSEPPGKADGRPLTIGLVLSGDLTAAVDRDSTSLTLSTGDHRAELHYEGLIAFDAAGTPLRAWFELRGERLFVRVVETGAQYPIVIDPWMQVAKLTASDGRRYDDLGWSVAADGNTVVVGARDVTIGKESTGDDAGAVYVFVRPTTGWANLTQVAKLWASDGKVDDDLGTSVAISGNTVVAGAPHNVEAPWAPGAAYVFVKPPNGWHDMTETAKLTPSDGTLMDFFGAGVSISGSTVVVGAPISYPYILPGAAYVFVKPLNGWVSTTETAKLTASDAATGLGRCVSISGNAVVAGASAHTGAAYVFVKPLTGWANMTQTARLDSSGFYKFAIASVAIYGNTVVAGSAGATVGSNQGQGKGYVFVRPQGGWTDMTQTAVLTASDGVTHDGLGISASIFGNSVVLGARFAAIGGNTNQGAAYVFVKPLSGWSNMTETSKLTSTNGGSNDEFGWSVAINSNLVAVGAIQTKLGNGAAYVFSSLPGTSAAGLENSHYSSSLVSSLTSLMINAEF